MHRTSGITVGLKMYRRGMLNDMERHQIAREIWLHIQLAHPSIIELYAAWKDRDYIYLVLEWAPEVCVCARGRCCEVPCPPRLGREGARVGGAPEGTLLIKGVLAWGRRRCVRRRAAKGLRTDPLDAATIAIELCSSLKRGRALLPLPLPTPGQRVHVPAAERRPPA